jgi:hypothetical protein
MASTATTSEGPVSQLKALVNQLVTVTTPGAHVTGVVLSCTRLSVWLVAADDVDVVVPQADITSLHEHGTAAAA